MSLAGGILFVGPGLLRGCQIGLGLREVGCDLGQLRGAGVEVCGSLGQRLGFGGRLLRSAGSQLDAGRGQPIALLVDLPPLGLEYGLCGGQIS